MARYQESVRCCNDACAQMIEIEFTEATRQLRVACISCGQLNQIEIILASDRGGHADRYGHPADGEKMKIVVLPGE